MESVGKLKAECPAKSLFTAPPANTVKSRSRTANCPDLCENVECFTENKESKTCEWCKGEGQKLDAMGVCVCDGSRNYYKDGQVCKHCSDSDKVVDGNSCVCIESSCINSKKEWDSSSCECGACEQEHVNECMGKGTFNMETCECTVVVIYPESTQINIYNGCFLGRSNILLLPSGYTDANRLLNAFTSEDHNWKFEECFGSNLGDYNTAVSSIQNTSDNVQEVIQKLYDCAKSAVNDNKQAFIDELTNEKRQCDSTNLNINVEIKL